MEPHRRIVQTWRTSEFPEDSTDSRVELLLEEVVDGTKITLIHTEIPDGQGDGYKQGWEDFYFTPMRAYFST
jgi:activator of HSP90 ATPase